MKFARYLEDTQTPEWKRAYINYRGLKKRIAAIRRAQEGFADDDLALARLGEEEQTRMRMRMGSGGGEGGEGREGDGDEIRESSPPHSSPSLSSHTTPAQPPQPHPTQSQSEPQPQPHTPSKIHRSGSSVLFRRRNSVGMGAAHPSPPPQPHPNLPLLPLLPLKDLLPHLPPTSQSFFDLLDSELDKIDSFYLDREKEAKERTEALVVQLGELKVHRGVFHEAHPPNEAFPARAKRLGDAINHALYRLRTRHFSPSSPNSNKLKPSESERTTAVQEDDDAVKRKTSLPQNGQREVERERQSHIKRNPEEYLHAKKRLKKAVLEHYRGLEVLNNYRILNLTGFRKALKKFEKVTKIPAQHAYMTEKVEPSAFASGAAVNAMMKEMEEHFAARFARGDKKKAVARLRTGAAPKSHHFSAFRSGLALGLAVPPLVSGVYQSFQNEVREEIPEWGALLYVYSALLVPVLYSLLVGVNLLVWARSRVNYVFIFELDPKTRLDYREYFEIPSILLCTLSYAFWLSFSRVGSDHLEPRQYPAIWLLFAVLLVFNPLPVMFRDSRWWLLRKVGRLVTSGTHHVEFTDFWLGDQFCSMIYTLSNLFFIACIYADEWDDPFVTCTATRHWVIPLILSGLPLFARFVQSMKRWFDSRLVTHLINGGKYATGIVYYGFYFNWRMHGRGRGATFALWVLWGTIYSSYALAWDLLMDWSVMKPRARYPFLRPGLLYTDAIPAYYWAIISDFVLRFLWVVYIPDSQSKSFYIRAFCVGMLEMLRRVQWNFFRLENEHLGNMDQYRVTREVPLPYRFGDEAGHDSDPGDEDADEDAVSMRSWFARRHSGIPAEANERRDVTQSS